METLGLVVAYADAGESFRKALRGVRAPQDRERIVSTLLGQVLYKQLRYDSGARALVLGTNLNDALYGHYSPLEAPPAGDDGQAVRIAEPLAGLFKDEVRRLARALALPATLAERQPFPASGLALRIMGEVTDERLAMLRQADAFFSEEVRATGQERRLWQYYASLCENPDQSGDYAVILRACQACSGEACASRLPYDLLERVTARILADLPQITRVVYDLTPSLQYALVE
jgi:GMP synthase (glutamine-hydrolysing)